MSLLSRIRAAFPNAKPASLQAESVSDSKTAKGDVQVRVRSPLFGDRMLIASVRMPEGGVQLLSWPLTSLRTVRLEPVGEKSAVMVRELHGEERNVFSSTDGDLARLVVQKISDAVVGSSKGSGLKFAAFLLVLFVSVSWMSAFIAKPGVAGSGPGFGRSAVDAKALLAQYQAQYPMPTMQDLAGARLGEVAGAKADLAKFGLGSSTTPTRGTTLASGGGILDPRNPIIAQCPASGK